MCRVCDFPFCGKSQTPNMRWTPTGLQIVLPLRNRKINGKVSWHLIVCSRAALPHCWVSATSVNYGFGKGLWHEPRDPWTIKMNDSGGITSAATISHRARYFERDPKRCGSDSGGWRDGWNSNTEAQKETDHNRLVTVNPVAVKRKKWCVRQLGSLAAVILFVLCGRAVCLSQAESSLMDDSAHVMLWCCCTWTGLFQHLMILQP